MKLTAIIIASACATSALADGGDYGLAIIDGTVAVGIGDHDEGTISDFGERVFAADMFVSGPNWFADEPGIFIEEASLPDNTQVGFTLTQSLMYWDGTGAVSFSQASDAMTLAFGPASVSTSMDNSPVAGFSINYDADTVGGFDEHMDYLLAGSAANGIYLLANTFSLSGAVDSDVIFTLFNAGLDEDAHDLAIEYAENVLVPTPGAASLLALAGFGAVSRRRRA
ncbi:MAG: hypothetical protein JJ974_04815 [Phycisphaerales bacterium]|nr:hypothetical protein [Phycisphaerales bacterium]